MPIRRALVVAALVLAVFAAASVEAQRAFLPAKGWVSDFANVVDSSTQTRLTALAQELDQKTHAQIAVVTVESLGGLSIERYARSLFNEWGIGHKDENRGVLILLATSDHKWRIEIGRGLESLLPNARVSQIGDKMLPDLQRSECSRAVLRSAIEIATIIAADRKVNLTNTAGDSLPKSTAETAPYK